MKASDSKLSDGHSPEHDDLVFEAEAYFRKLFDVSEISYEVPVSAVNGFIVGYIDLLITIEIVSKGDSYFIKHAVEVKPAVYSFGALLRQLNTYKMHIGYNRSKDKLYRAILSVYTHDQQYAAQIESQGYACYPKPTKKKSKTK